jgi:hypothetical protein
VADVDNYMQEPYDTWRFSVDTEKAVRRGISVDTINRNLSMAMGGYKLGDVKQGTVLDPTYIILQVPFEIRALTARLGELPIPAADGTTVPLAELGRFTQVAQDPVIYHKDLRPVEYVVGEAVGELAAPIYGMFAVEELLKGYTTPDGVVLSGEMLGAPADNGHSAFEWTGEWTVTYETFRDMGAAFGVALILIYILVVWEFGNFLVPAVIMAPIPLTLIGIIPGHWLLGAEFTATSMIGFIALAGIIVRNSILLVDFTITQVKQGVDVREAVIISCKTRTRPIMITAWALVMGSTVILFDPIFQGMAISLLFGVLVSTMLTLIVIPLGCISARAVFCPVGSSGGAGGCGVATEPPPIPVVQGGGLSIGEVVMGAWRLFSMVMRSLLFKLWTLAMGALFGLIEMWQRRKSVAATAAASSRAPTTATTRAPSVATTVVAREVSPPAPEPVVTPASGRVTDEPREGVEAKVAHTAEPEPSEPSDADVAPVLAKSETASTSTGVAPPKGAVPRKRGAGRAVKSVSSSPIKKKSVTKKKIALKQAAPTKGAPAKSGATREEVDTKESRNRRGIRLKNFDDDFNL